jgi:hypothetical protein
VTKKLFMVVSGVVLMVGLAACSGKEGPMGPTGPTGATGPGSQTVYTQDVTPLYEAASLDLNCPEIVADPNTGQTSTVVCYLTRTGYDSFYVLPVSLADTASGTTAYSYKISTGILTLLWDNSSALVPPAFQVRVTVVNQ